MAEITYREKALTVADFERLRKAAGWDEKPVAQLAAALAGGLHDVVAECGGRVVGAGRLVGDGAMYWDICDVVVLPESRGRGIGAEITRRLIEHVRRGLAPGQRVALGLFAAKGKDAFYGRFGFKARPDDGHGPGMVMYLEG